MPNLKTDLFRRCATTVAAISLTAVLAGCAAQAGPSGVADNLVSHVAEYKLRLVSTRPGSSVVAARGAFGYRFEKVCDGWISEIRNSLLLQGQEGRPVNSSYSMTQWEDFSATHYRFRVRDFQDGYLTDEVTGEARRDGDKVIVHYEKPADVTDELPADTLFPTQHMIKLIDHAAKGRHFTNDLVFDGGGDTPTYHISSVISGQKPSESTAEDKDGISKKPFRRFSMAFFPIDDPTEDKPAFEMSIDYARNGVAEGLVQNYGDFRLKGKLVRVRKLPAPECK